jgi:hypothetical protein
MGNAWAHILLNFVGAVGNFAVGRPCDVGKMGPRIWFDDRGRRAHDRVFGRIVGVPRMQRGAVVACDLVPAPLFHRWHLPLLRWRAGI